MRGIKSLATSLAFVTACSGASAELEPVLDTPPAQQVLTEELNPQEEWFAGYLELRKDVEEQIENGVLAGSIILGQCVAFSDSETEDNGKVRSYVVAAPLYVTKELDNGDIVAVTVFSLLDQIIITEPVVLPLDEQKDILSNEETPEVIEIDDNSNLTVVDSIVSPNYHIVDGQFYIDNSSIISSEGYYVADTIGSFDIDVSNPAIQITESLAEKCSIEGVVSNQSGFMLPKDSSLEALSRENWQS